MNEPERPSHPPTRAEAIAYAVSAAMEAQRLAERIAMPELMHAYAALSQAWTDLAALLSPAPARNMSTSTFDGDLIFGPWQRGNPDDR